MGIEGAWGSGKSTIIGFVKKELSLYIDESARPIVVDFNPWMVSNTGAMIDALVTQIAATINYNPNSPEKAIKVGEKLLGYVGLIKHLKYLKYIPGGGFAGHIAADVSEFADRAGAGAKEARDALDDIKKTLPTLDLAKRKAEVVEALRDLDHPIVVIVDDLDRLPADEVRTMVQAIKAVADFPRTTYLLAYDHHVVSSALGNADVVAGSSYLEKIVQVAYPIPPLFEYQLRSFVDKQLKSLLLSIDLTLRDYEAATYQTALGHVTRLARHPRDVVRLINRLMLSLPATRNEVNAVDVIVFEALSQRFPQIRDSVHRHPTDFTGHAFRGDSGFDDDDFDWTEWASIQAERKNEKPLWERYLPNHESGRFMARKACAFLFPEGAGKHERVPEDELHLADPDRLARYFRMTSLESVPEAGDIHDLLAKPLALADALGSTDEGDLTFLLEWIYNYLPSSQQLDVGGSTTAIIERSLRSRVESSLTSDLAELFGKVLARLIRRAPVLDRQPSFEQVIARAPLSISEKVLLEAAADQGKWNVRPEMIKPVDAQLIADEPAVDLAIEAWSDSVRQRSVAGDLQAESRMHAILYRFAQLGFAYDETFEFVEKICSTEVGLRKFLATHVKGSPFNTADSYSLVKDAAKLAERIRGSDLKEAYSWLADQLTTEEWEAAIKEQLKRLIDVKRSTSA